MSQIARPAFTVQNILGEPNAGAGQIAQELGFAGFRHIGKKHPNVKEIVAT